MNFSLAHPLSVLGAGRGICLCLASMVALRVAAGPGPANVTPPPMPGAELFTNGPMLRLRITLTDADLASLRRDGRQDVPARVQAGTSTWPRVALHLKGSTGSFRGVEDKPALTLSFNQFDSGQRFHGLRKLHLNNSVEDPSYFHEFAGAALFRAAGVPAPRVTHALVELNGRRLGLYVLKEGFAAEFLALHFQRTDGNLYDTGPGHDVDERLARDLGSGPDDRRDLQALAAAAKESDLTQRWQALGKTLDVDRFLSFMAMEVIAGHRDGYCLARNNFRLYHDPATDRMVFLPHGMDQLFGRSNATLSPVMAGLVARAVRETPAGQRQYRTRLATLVTNALDVAALHRQADAFLARARPALERREFAELQTAVTATKARIAQRRLWLDRALCEPEPSRLPFEQGVAHLTTWQAVDPPAGGAMEQGTAPDGRNALHIRAGPMTSASWRTKVLLAPGRYRFAAAVLARGVVALKFGNNRGAGLRVVNGTAPPRYEFVGDQPWTKLEREFELGDEQEVELICELRAAAGDAWFELESLRLRRVP